MCMLSHSVVPDSATLWIVAHQDPLSLGFSRQEYWNGLPCPPPGNLPDPELNPRLLHLLHCIQILYYWATWEIHSPWYVITKYIKSTKFFKFYHVPGTLLRGHFLPITTLWGGNYYCFMFQARELKLRKIKNCPRTSEPEAAELQQPNSKAWPPYTAWQIHACILLPEYGLSFFQKPLLHLPKDLK